MAQKLPGVRRYTVRHLTPLEEWRLMDFDDADYWAARKALEDRYYKGKDQTRYRIVRQAGNSVAVGVMESVIAQIWKTEPHLFDGGLTVGSLFSGIGGFEKALERFEPPDPHKKDP